MELRGWETKPLPPSRSLSSAHRRREYPLTFTITVFSCVFSEEADEQFHLEDAELVCHFFFLIERGKPHLSTSVECEFFFLHDKQRV